MGVGNSLASLYPGIGAELREISRFPQGIGAKSLARELGFGKFES